ncbi:MAG: hypothetical protein M8467_11770 [Anaerolineae bacterium]|nr:hypothetical protein [Anaerolineae bacterium]
MRRFHTQRRARLLALVAYTLLALALTWPLLVQFGSHVPGNGVDDPPLTWNLWWVPHALLELGTNPFDCNYLFYPLGINLSLYTLTVLNGLLSIPLQVVVGLVPASNLLLLSSFVLSAYGAFLLASYLLARYVPPGESQQPRGAKLPGRLGGWWSVLPAFAAGLLYGFAANKLNYAALGQWNIASSQWIPFYVLYLLKVGSGPRQSPGRRWRDPVLAALFLVLQAYAELTYATFLVLFTALWLLWQAIVRLRKGQIAQLGRLGVGLAIVAILFAAGLSPMLAMMLPDLLAAGDILVEGGGFAGAYSADLLGFFVPSSLHPLFGSLVEGLGVGHSVGQHVYVGYGVLILASVGILYGWRRRTVRFWSLAAALFWLLTLGPSLRVNGQGTGVPLPFALVARLPFFEGNRYPSRYSVMLLLCLAMLVAFGLSFLLSRQRPSRSRFVHLAAPLLVLLLLFEHLSMPLPLSDMRVPDVYRTLQREMPGDFALLDLPVAWRNGFRVTGTQHPTIMFQQYYQSVHQKRLLAGNTSRNPPLKFQYFTEAPLINTLIALETGQPVAPAVVERDRALAPQVLRFFDIQAIVVHPGETGPGMIPYVESTMPVQAFYDDGQIVAYRVQLPPWPERWDIEPGDDLARLSFAEGWGVPAAGIIWAQRQEARLLVPLSGQEARLAFRAYAPGPGQQLRLQVEEWESEPVALAPGWQDYELSLPVDVGLNEVRLHFEERYPAGSAQVSPRAIGSTGVESPVNLVVQSAGLDVGSFGHIYVDGRDVALGQRGYHVAVLDPQTGSLEQVASFDTHLDAGASQALADMLRDVPTGHLVAVAAADEASRLLGQEAVDALRGIGASGDLREKFRWGHAMVGVQGAAPGTAIESLDWMRPVSIVVGEGATEPFLAVAFDGIRFTTGLAAVEAP